MPGAIPGVTDVGSVTPLSPNPQGNKSFPSLTPSQSATNAKAAGATTTSTSTNNTQTLGKTAFLQLLVQEMTNQDPLQPASDTQFVAQLAQFSSLEQMQNMNTTLGSLVTNNQMAEANAMIGHDVTSLNSSTGAQVNGVVDKVISTAGTDSSGNPTQNIQVDVSGTPVNVSDVQSVGPLDPSYAQSTTGGSGFTAFTQQIAEATAMLGHTVTGTNSAGSAVSGTVDKVVISNTTDSAGTPIQTVQVDVNGTALALSAITSVAS